MIRNVVKLIIKYYNNFNNNKDFIKKLPPGVILVPKIESPTAIKNISDIVNALPTKERILMLDHDDLFSEILKNNEPIDVFKKYMQ